MTEQVTIARVEICGGYGAVRVFLSDGKELTSLRSVTVRPIDPNSVTSVHLEAVICAPDDAAG